MTDVTRVIFPVLSSPGPTGGMLAYSFEGHESSLQLRNALEDETPPTHAGQQAVDAVLRKHGIEAKLIVTCDLDAAEAATLCWRIPLAVQALLALRERYSGLAEALHPDDIVGVLQEAGIAKRMLDGHRIRAALEGAVHARVDLDGGAIAFDLPEAAMIWLRVPAELASSTWTKAQAERVVRKRAAGAAERFGATLLRAACNDGIAVFEAFESVDTDESVYRAIPAWLPARQAAKEVAPGAVVSLESAGPDMLIFADNEDAASRAAVAALQTFQAHAIEVEIHAWSSIDEQA